MTRLNRTGLILLLFVLSVLAALVVSVGDVRAQGRQEKLAVLLAATCVAEISFQHSTRECQIMWKVNTRNAIRKGRGLYRQTILFNSYWQSRTLQARRPWIAHLNSGRRPHLWPRRWRWSAHKEIWLSYLKAAREHVRRPLSGVDHCPRAIDYGAPGEIPGGPVVPIDCGGTLQQYWGFRGVKK
jgi:hypothetical protein